MKKPSPKPSVKSPTKAKNVADMTAAEYQRMVKKQQAEYEKRVAAFQKKAVKSKNLATGRGNM